MNGILRTIAFISFIQIIHFHIIKGDLETKTTISKSKLFTLDWELSYNRDKTTLQELLFQNPPKSESFVLHGYPKSWRAYLKCMKNLDGDRYVTITVENDDETENSNVNKISLECSQGRGPNWEKHYFLVKDEIKILPSMRIEDFIRDASRVNSYNFVISISEMNYSYYSSRSLWNQRFFK